MSDINVGGSAGGGGLATDAGQIAAANALAAAMQSAAATQAAASTGNVAAWLANNLLIPGAQVAAQILLLNHQYDKYEEIEEERIGYLDCAKRQWCERMRDLRNVLDDIIDDVPETAMYQPVSISGEQMEHITDHLQALQYTEQYAEQITKFHLEHDLAKQAILNPKYYEVVNAKWDAIYSLVDGKLPFDDIVEIKSDTADTAILTGKVGNSCRLELRNLGISTMRAQKFGREEARLELQADNTFVSRPDRNGDARTFEMDLSQRINFAIAQGISIQNSLQNAYDTCARKAPYLWRQMELDVNIATVELQMQASKANITNAFVPDYANIFSDQIASIAGGIGGAMGNIFNRSGSQAPYASATPAPYASATPVSVPSAKEVIN